MIKARTVWEDLKCSLPGVGMNALAVRAHNVRIWLVVACLAILELRGCSRVEFSAGTAPARSESVIIEHAPHPPARQRLFITVHGGAETAVAHSYRRPPPWPNGNCLTLYMLSPKQWDDMVRDKSWSQLKASEAQLANMNAENLHEIVKRLDLKAVEVEYVDVGGRLVCFIVDTRIGKE